VNRYCSITLPGGSNASAAPAIVGWRDELFGDRARGRDDKDIRSVCIHNATRAITIHSSQSRFSRAMIDKIAINSGCIGRHHNRTLFYSCTNDLLNRMFLVSPWAPPGRSCDELPIIDEKSRAITIEAVAALHQRQVKWPGWKIHRPRSALPIALLCFGNSVNRK